MYVGSDGLHDKEDVDCGYNETYRFDNKNDENEAHIDGLGGNNCYISSDL